MTKLKIFFFFIPIILIIFYWKNTLVNISDHLYDWNDPLYIIWVIQNNLDHFKSLDFQHIYDTTAMYPFRFSLSFAEQFYFPSLIVLLIAQLSQNSILQLNLLLIVNHILIFVSFYLLIGLFVRHFWSKIISSFYISFSPYFLAQLGHIQMIFYWPILMSLYFLFKNKVFEKTNIKNILFAGIFLGLQFMSSIYLGVMGLVIIFLYFAIRVLFEGKIIFLSRELLIFLVIFFITAGISINGYFLLKNEYGGKRDIGEYITYSAHLSDYIFIQGSQTSFIYKNIPIFGRWNRFDHHNAGETASFIGILPVFIIFLYLLKYKKVKSVLSLSVNLNKFTFFLVLLGLTGFVFSLGPRLSINGAYLHIPLPYYFVLKYIPFMDSLRALARWFFLVILAVSFLVGLGIDEFSDNLAKKLSSKKVFFIGFLVFVLFLLEFYPKPIEVSKKDWWNNSYAFMKNKLCLEDNPAVLEYPFVYRNIDANIINDLQYKMVILLASTQHECKILSGFSGYEPPEYIKVKEQLDNGGIDEKDLYLMRNLGFDYLKLNKFALTKEENISLAKVLKNLRLRLVYGDNEVNIYNIGNKN